ncbi:hypothetical protein [Novosphingobium sp.]|jgi:hypothetical protein|uniref:hypothetical protein n=1 Tax=Novosphingobium sp. TaxID=1874826 RepID=UPI002FE3E396
MFAAISKHILDSGCVEYALRGGAIFMLAVHADRPVIGLFTWYSKRDRAARMSTHARLNIGSGLPAPWSPDSAPIAGSSI